MANSVHLHNWSGYQTVVREIFFVPDMFFISFVKTNLSHIGLLFSCITLQAISHTQTCSYNRSQQDALFLNFIFDIQLYMFRTDLLSTIRIIFTAIGVCYTYLLHGAETFLRS